MSILNARTYQTEHRVHSDLETLIDALPFGVAIVDAGSGVVKSFNREVQRIMERVCTPGLPIEDLMGELTCRFEDGSDVLIDDVGVVGELISEKSLHAEEVVFSIPGGCSVAVLADTAPIQYPEGDDAVVVTMQDLDHFEERERQREAFLDLVSHELRVPLAAITGSAVTLGDSVATLDPAEMSAYFRIIIEQAEHMRTLIDDLLDVGQVQSATFSVSAEPTEVARLLEKARNTFVRAGGRHEVVIDLAPDLPRVMSDQHRIQQVLTNLFMNAARRAPETTPIRITALCEGTQVSISVKNEGRGIEPDRMAQLFEKYANDDTDGFREGLTLAICKGLVEAHGGRIYAESDGPRQGACFTFTIPAVLNPENPQIEASESASQTGYIGRSTRILVVDDDPQTLRFVRETLSEVGYTVLVTGDHRELSQLIRNEQPDLVLLDLIFPDADGIELLENNHELASLPVIFISVYGRDKTVAHALERGAADYLVKPLSPIELIARIQVALRGRRGSLPFEFKGLTIYYDEHRVVVDGNDVELTATEFELLRILSHGAGRVMTYDNLSLRVWRGDGDPDLVRTFVKQLRRKLGDDARDPRWIFNQRGAGYFMPGTNDSYHPFAHGSSAH